MYVYKHFFNLDCFFLYLFYTLQDSVKTSVKIFAITFFVDFVKKKLRKNKYVDCDEPILGEKFDHESA